MNRNIIKDLKISDLAFGGNGVGRTEDGLVIFVPYTIPGEVIDVELVKKHKSYAEGRIVEIKKSSDKRIKPKCKYFGECGGCQYQHIEYIDELKYKQSQLNDVLQRIGKLPQEALDKINAIIASENCYNYRNKLTLQPIIQTKDLTEYGFFSSDNSELIEIKECPLAMEGINKLLPKISLTKWGQDNSFRRIPSKCIIRETYDKTVKYFFGRIPKKIPWLTEQLMGKEISLPPGSFFQVNPSVAEKVYKKVISWIDESETVVDAYCGIGIYSLLLPPMQNVFSIDNDKKAIKAAYHNSMQFGLDNRSFFVEQAEKALPEIFKENQPNSLCIILNPPREGCNHKLIFSITKALPKKVIIVSCNASTLARDLKKLLKTKKYEISEISIFDMFPRTAHFETAVVLNRIG
ncbi:MAG: class I SAM-dependent RNA methyltransferase [Verrucomicrobiota bacterium]|nr:class I SAM-dependent RNA methyltransferase [Verrucomicrobiota bacterium]